jgi:hypothetical protein
MSIVGGFRQRERPKSLAALFSRQATDSIQPGYEHIVFHRGRTSLMVIGCQIPLTNTIRAIIIHQ